uniref:histidine kinase n=1 Tax=uncultured Bacteroidota bacterium TaxID=152509 RepID=H5SIG2_9BACT|nr:hypothetical conserved protein [uncultured Bacteroidetes bacterium]
MRQWGAEPFPLYVDVYRIGVQWRETSHSYEYLVPGDRGLLAYFRYPLRDRAAYFATLPLLLALLGIGLLLERASELWQMLKSLFLREGPLARQLQSLFWILVILSFFGIMVVSMFIFFQLSQQSIKKELHQRLLTVTAYLSGDPVLTEKLRYGLSSYIPVEESFVRDLMRRVAFLSGTEVFLYTQGGYLYSSTLPRAYWDKYGIPFLDPAVLEGMQNASAGPLIQEAPGGKRLIGYAPLRGGDGSLAGIVQVPMPLSQKAFYDPLRYFIGYVVNVYLLLMGGAILVGLLLIQRFSGGLERVVAQLRAVSGAPSPPLLHWEGKEDEIATLVEAYNDMVKKLQASQRQLEATLRRVSQQEIAFQAAHEIKTALTPLKIHLQHLQRMPTVDPDKLQEMATRLLQRIDALVRIANAFMSFARLGSAEPPQLTLIELGRFLEEQLHPFLQGPIPLELRLPESPLWIQGNADYLHQVLNNLLQNALQALEGHPAPHIWVTLTREGNEAILSLQDNGPGIPPEVQERIFEFYFTTRRTGTGLGLAITKGLVERMGGRISFTSEVGRGTVFYVAFPLASA